MEKAQNYGMVKEKKAENYDAEQVPLHQLSTLKSGTDKKPVFFPFPFPPYDIQEDFMNTLFEVLDSGQVGIFESPTGTVGVIMERILRSEENQVLKSSTCLSGSQ